MNLHNVYETVRPARLRRRSPRLTAVAASVGTVLVLSACTGVAAQGSPQKSPPKPAVVVVQPPDKTPDQVASPTDPDAGTVRTFLLHLSSGPFNVAQEAARRSTIVLNAWETRYIGPLKAANPNLRVLVYKDLSSTRDYEDPSQRNTAGGLNYHTADPSFFLLNYYGQRQTYGSYSGHVVMDVGNPAYQQAWIADVKAELSQFRWDGVFIDNVMWGPTDRIYSVHSPKYPTDWTGAYASAVATIGDNLRASGFQAFGNIQEARLRADIWQQHLQHLDGAMEEMFTGWGRSVLTGWALQAQMDLIKTAEAMGKTALMRAPANSIGPEASANYAVGTYLMTNGSRSSVSQQVAYDMNKTTYWSVYSNRLGAALGPATNTNGLYTRTFSGGVVVLNTSGFTRHADLGRTLTNAATGAQVSAVDVAPFSVAFLAA